ncbi:MAG TPA: glycosyl hydrolase family 18 protein [Solirubrobacteraceae bacterium]|jgi:spore germination protein YaaH
MALVILKRVLVRLVLVASIAPVILLGPGLVRAPMKLVRELALRHHIHHVRLPGRVHGLRVLHSTPVAVRLVWRAAHRGRFPVEGYRVWRDGAVVGQTKGRSVALRVGGARVHVLAVAAVDTRGHLGPRVSLATGVHLPPGGSKPHAVAHAPVAASVPRAAAPPPHAPAAHVPPTPPTLLAAERVTDTSATLSWQAGTVTTGTLVGYMLYQDGEPEQVVHGQSVTLSLASQRSYTFTVRTLDSSGDLSEPAPDLTVLTTHTPPSTPGELAVSQITESSATLSWSASEPVSGNIVGYRIFRDGLPVGEYSATSVTLENLAPSTDYHFTVVAADSLGAVSAPTAALDVRTADPTPTHGNVQAFLLASTDLSFDDLQAHYQQIGVVYPTYFNCGSEGAVSGQDDPLVTGWARARQIAVLPRLNCQNANLETQILTNTNVRETFIGNLASLCTQYDYQGIQIDFEGAPPSDREPFTAFITELAARLHAQGDKLSTIVTAKTYNIHSGRAAMYDDAALSVPSDWVFVLDWGIHWTTSAPGPLDEMPWFKKVAEYAATMPNLNKFVLGMPLYGIDWKGAGGSANPGAALEFSNVTALAGEFGVIPSWDSVAQDPWFTYTDGEGAGHTVWYTDRQSVQARVELAESLGLGVGLWHLGSEDQSVWSLSGLGGS